MTHEDGFLAAILADPDSDDVRLIYADWLEEHDATVERPCPACGTYADDAENPWREIGYHPARDPASGRHEGGWTNCKTCNGGGPECVRAGVVLGPNGYGARAEFIRLQIRLANTTCSELCTPKRCVCLRKEMGRRERQILSATNCDGRWTNNVTWFEPWRRHCQPTTDHAGWVFRRGFVEEIWLPATDWLMHSDAILNAAPVRHVQLTSLPPLRYRADHDNGGRAWFLGASYSAELQRRKNFTAKSFAYPFLQSTAIAELLAAEWGPKITFDVLPTPGGQT